MKTIVCTMATTLALAITVAAHSDEKPDDTVPLASQCTCSPLSIFERIDLLEKEIRKGDKAHTKQELQRLEDQLRDYQNMVVEMNRG